MGLIARDKLVLTSDVHRKSGILFTLANVVTAVDRTRTVFVHLDTVLLKFFPWV